MKYSLEDVRREYDRLDLLCGIDTRGIELKISSRATRQLGSFRYPKRPGAEKLRITLSTLVMDEEKLFFDTIRHEYAHAAVYLLYPNERHGHDEKWKAMCRLVGCSPKSRSALSADASKQRDEKAKYIVRCDSCGRETAYLRRGKVVDTLLRGRGKNLRCTVCGGNKISLITK